MTPRFVDLFISRQHQFSLGIDRQTGGHYLSTPVTRDGQHHLAEYEAHYRIGLDEFERFREDPGSAREFIEVCRQGGHRDRLIG